MIVSPAVLASYLSCNVRLGWTERQGSSRQDNAYDATECGKESTHIIRVNAQLSSFLHPFLPECHHPFAILRYQNSKIWFKTNVATQTVHIR